MKRKNSKQISSKCHFWKRSFYAEKVRQFRSWHIQLILNFIDIYCDRICAERHRDKTNRTFDKWCTHCPWPLFVSTHAMDTIWEASTGTQVYVTTKLWFCAETNVQEHHWRGHRWSIPCAVVNPITYLPFKSFDCPWVPLWSQVHFLSRNINSIWFHLFHLFVSV